MELELIEKSLSSVSKENSPYKWASLMNIKGVLHRNQGDFKEAESAFISALFVDDVVLKCKILINYAMTEFLKKDIIRALQVLDRLFEIIKANKKLNLNLYLGYGHLLRGQIYHLKKEEKAAVAEFMRAEFFFEIAADPRGVGLSCLEITRAHIKSKNITAAWNFLRKAENFLSRLGDEEQFGVALCKAIALYYSNKAEEAWKILDAAYRASGKESEYKYVIDEVLDAYLDTHWRMSQAQQALM